MCAKLRQSALDDYSEPTGRSLTIASTRRTSDQVTASTPATSGRSPCAAITRVNRAAESLGVRCWVSKSTWTMPKRWAVPHAHSKLSSSDQTK